MGYHCAKFGDFGFSRFGFIVQTHTHTHTQTDRITDADDCYTRRDYRRRSNNNNICNIC